MKEDVRFLTVAEVVALHEPQLARFGGQAGIRDFGLPESATAMPQASFGGELLHSDLFAMAAAYAFQLALNHPFVESASRCTRR